MANTGEGRRVTRPRQLSDTDKARALDLYTELLRENDRATATAIAIRDTGLPEAGVRAVIEDFHKICGDGS